MSVIYEAIDKDFTTISKELGRLHADGYDVIQIPPVQPHCTHIKPWYRLYQPVANAIGNSLGTSYELKTLIQSIHNLGMKAIIDVVLHHTSGCPLCNTTKSLKFFGGKVWGWVTHSTTPPSRYNMTDWGPKEDMASSLQSQVQFLQALVDMGADGFRFDAAKHIRPQHLHLLLQCLKPPSPAPSPSTSPPSASTSPFIKHLVSYGEVMDGNPEICNEYTTITQNDSMAMGTKVEIHRNTIQILDLSTGNKVVIENRVSDFPSVFKLIDAFKYGGDINDLSNMRPIEEHAAVRFGNCHDSLMKPHAYSFGDAHDGILALCYLLCAGHGIVLVYHTESQDHHVISAIKFFRSCFGQPTHYPKLRSFFDEETAKTIDHKCLLMLQRGDIGLAVFNKSDRWIDVPKCRMPCLSSGTYVELVHKFVVEVCDGDGGRWVKRWGDGRGGMKIGPRELLMLLKQ